MNLTYEILSFQIDTTGYDAVFTTDARIKITIDERLFLELEDVLLLEFACFANDWVSDSKDNNEVSFYYKSMNEEEEPLLSFECIGKDRFRATSCWSDAEVQPLSFKQIKDCFAAFLCSLEAELMRRYGYDIKRVLNKA